MSSSIKYSICSTIYNSANTLEAALKPLCNLGHEFEIIIIDNFSADNTVEILKQYDRNVQFLQMKCTRGSGRQRAIELSNGEFVIQVDLDVKYVGISNIIRENEELLQNYILNIQSKNTKCNAPIIIGKKIFFDKIGGYPNLNHVEDIYLYKKAEALDLIKYVENNYPHECLNVGGKSSGVESRYEKSIYRKIVRRAIACRDLIFVSGATYNEVMKRYKLFGLKKVYQGIPLFFTGKFLSLFIKVPDLDKEIMRLKNLYKVPNDSQ